MAREEDTGKSTAELRARAWDLARKIRYCMFVTWDGKKQAARAMDATVSKDASAIYFLTDKAGKKVGQIRKFPVVTITWSDPDSFKFVTMSGEAKISNDRDKIRELWSSADKAWWDSAEDPDIRVVTFMPAEAEIWDSPNLLVSTALMFSAAVTGKKPKIGDHAKVTMPASGASLPATEKEAKSKAAAGKKAPAKTAAKAAPKAPAERAAAASKMTGAKSK